MRSLSLFAILAWAILPTSQPVLAASPVLDVLGRLVCPNEAPLLRNGNCVEYVGGFNTTGNYEAGCKAKRECECKKH